MQKYWNGKGNVPSPPYNEDSWVTRKTCSSHVPIFMDTWKMGGFKQKVTCSKLFNTSRHKYKKMNYYLQF